MTLKTRIFTHHPRVTLARFMFCWWRHNRLAMTSQWPDNCDANTWQAISNSLDIDFIHCDIHGRSCKNVIYYIDNYRNWGRISTWRQMQKRHPIPRPKGRSIGCVCISISINVRLSKEHVAAEDGNRRMMASSNGSFFPRYWPFVW